MSQQTLTPSYVWENFRTAFEKTLNETNDQQMERLKTAGDRKYFFSETILPQVAKHLDLEYRNEFLRVDYTFFKKGIENGWRVPIVFIESENNWDSCYEESLKLCSTNAPLKVLIAYGLPLEREKDLENNDINDRYVVEDFLKETQLVGWYVIMVYDDTNNETKFHTFVYNENGERVTEKSIPIIISKN